MFLDDLVANVKELIQPISARSIDTQHQEPARFFEIRDPVQTRESHFETEQISPVYTLS